MYGVACHGPWQQKIQEVERAFGRKEGGVIGVRWLLGIDRKRRKTFSSLVVFFKRAVPTAESMYVKSRGRKHMVDKYL